MSVAVQNSIFPMISIFFYNFNLFFLSWRKNMLSIEAFTKGILVFWKNIFIEVMLQLTIKASFIYFWNIWSLVWFICSSIAFVKWTNLTLLESAIKFPSVIQWLMLLYVNSENKSQNSFINLTLSRRGPLSYRNQSIDLLCKSMDWFLYDSGLRLERVNWYISQLSCFFRV